MANSALIKYTLHQSAQICNSFCSSPHAVEKSPHDHGRIDNMNQLYEKACVPTPLRRPHTMLAKSCGFENILLLSASPSRILFSHSFAKLRSEDVGPKAKGVRGRGAL